jgi:hypothetical protein
MPRKKPFTPLGGIFAVNNSGEYALALFANQAADKAA